MADLEPIGVQAVVEGVSEFNSELGQMQDAIERTGDSAEVGSRGMSEMGDVVGAIVQAGLIEELIAQMEEFSTHVLQAFIANAGEAEQVDARLTATLRALGESAAITKEQAVGLADSIQGLSTFEDEAVLSAETMLLRFTSIGEDVFPQALQASVDLAAGLGMDLTSAARMLGMALESPADGMSRLRRMGVMFTEEQQNTIKAMQEAGDAAGAQALMLDVLNSKFGGTAAAMADTYQGRLQQLQNTMGNLQETIGAALLPTLTKLAEAFNEALSNPIAQQFFVVAASFVAVGAAAMVLVPKVIALVGAIQQIGAVLPALLASPIVAVVLAVTAVLGGLAAIVIHTTNVSRELDAQVAALNQIYTEHIAIVNNLQGVLTSGATGMSEHEREIVKIDMAERNHSRTLRDTLDAELALLQAQEDRLLATLADIEASDGLDVATRAALLSQNEMELATVRAAMATKEEELAFLADVNAARALATETARLQGQADAYAASGAAAAEAARVQSLASSEAATAIAAAESMSRLLNDANYVAISAHDQLAGKLVNEAQQMWAVVDAMNAYYLRTADALIGVTVIEQAVGKATSEMAANGTVAADTMLRLGSDMLIEAEKIRAMGPAFPDEDLAVFNASVDETIRLISESTTLTDAQREALLRLAEGARETANSNRQSASEMAAAWQESLAIMSQGAQGLLDRMNELTAQEWIVEMGFEAEGLPEGLLPMSPKSRWQGRLEMLDAWTRSHTIGIDMEVNAGGEIGDPFAWLTEQMGFGGKLGGFGGYFSRIYQEQELDPLLDQLDALDEKTQMYNDALASGRLDAGMYSKVMQDLALTEEERARILDELAEKQERLQRLQEAQQQLDFLEQQMKLLDLITEYGLNPEDILAGVELGANANVEGILDALTRAMEAIVAQGAGAFPTFGETIEPPGGGIVTGMPIVPGTKAIQVTVGPNYIENGMDETLFAARVEQIISEALAAA